MTLYEKGFLNGQLALFRRLHELSYRTKSSEDYLLQLGILYGEFLKANPSLPVIKVDPARKHSARESV